MRVSGGFRGQTSAGFSDGQNPAIPNLLQCRGLEPAGEKRTYTAATNPPAATAPLCPETSCTRPAGQLQTPRHLPALIIGRLPIAGAGLQAAVTGRITPDISDRTSATPGSGPAPTSSPAYTHARSAFNRNGRTP